MCGCCMDHTTVLRGSAGGLCFVTGFCPTTLLEKSTAAWQRPAILPQEVMRKVTRFHYFLYSNTEEETTEKTVEEVEQPVSLSSFSFVRGFCVVCSKRAQGRKMGRAGN